MPATGGKRTERLKILVSSYACDPRMGSEPGMGGNWVLQLAQHHDLWVLTEERFAKTLLEYLEDHCPEIKHAIHVFGIPRHRISWGEKLWEAPFYYWTYRSWQKNAYRKAEELFRQVNFDLVHQLNMIGYREPGYLWKLPTPFIWGPIGGHAQMPWRFVSSLGLQGAIQCGVRNILNWIQMRISCRVRKAIRRADVLVAATDVDAYAVEKIHRRSAALLNEQGASLCVKERRERRQDSNVLRVVWCGLFVARKALHLGLDAVHKARRKIQLELHVIGDGDRARHWKRIAKDHGLHDICHWHGKLPRNKVLNVMAMCDVMLFTSLQEGTPAVVLEAIQLGLPVICHNSCGFGAVVNDACGIKIPVINPRRSVQGMADALIRLGAESGLVERLSEGAIQRASELAWERKTEEMLALYKEAISFHSAKCEK